MNVPKNSDSTLVVKTTEQVRVLLQRIATTIGDFLNNPKNFDHKLGAHGRSLQGLEEQGLMHDAEPVESDQEVLRHA